jgi:hypothetical protein
MQEYMTSDSESDRSSISSINFTGLDKLIGISDGSNASRPRFKNQERLAMMQRKALDNSETDSATTGSESKGGPKGRKKQTRTEKRKKAGRRNRKRKQQKKTPRNNGPNPQAHLPSTQSNAAMTDPSEDHEETNNENDGMNDRTTGTKNQERFATMQGDRTRPQKPRPQMMATRDGNVYGRTESGSESESDMSGREMMGRMEANSKRIIVDESSNSEAESEVESETSESEWEDNVNMARQRRVGTNRREDDPDTSENHEETESDDDTDQDKKPRAKRKR